MTNYCNTPPQAMPPAVPLSPCEQLEKLRSVLHSVLAGTRAQVRYGDQWVSYHKGDVAGLRAEIRRLEILCDDGGMPRGRAVQLGPRRAVSSFCGSNRYGSFRR